MSVTILPELVPYVRALIASGRCRSEGEVIQEALRLLQELDRRRSELQQDIQAGMGSGASIPGEEVFVRLERQAADLCLQQS